MESVSLIPSNFPASLTAPWLIEIHCLDLDPWLFDKPKQPACGHLIAGRYLPVDSREALYPCGPPIIEGPFDIKELHLHSDFDGSRSKPDCYMTIHRMDPV